MLYLGLFNALLSLVLFLFAPFIISVVFGEQYLDAVVPFRILCVSYIFSGTLGTISGNLLVTQRKLKFNLFVSVLSSALNTVLNCILIQKYGAAGAAWATLFTAVVSSAVSTSYLLYVFHRIPKTA